MIASFQFLFIFMAREITNFDIKELQCTRYVLLPKHTVEFIIVLIKYNEPG
jgi:hypothetical protein